MLRRLALALLIAPLIFSANVSAAPAPDTKNKGLYVSPLRSYLTLNAGQSVTRAFTAANLTDSPMTITTDIDQFSMVDYSYDYRFNEVDNDWVKLTEPATALKPYESHELAYTVTVPKNAAPGGHYYTLYAAAPIKNGDNTTSTVRVATLLYLTVQGTLTRSLQVTKSSIPYFSADTTIPYSFDVKNTGNIHYFALVSARIDGLFYSDAPNGTSQLLMPGTTRTINASITTPPLPGIYNLTYTITPEDGSPIQKSQYFIYAPLWSIITLSLLIAAIVKIIQHCRKKSKKLSEQ